MRNRMHSGARPGSTPMRSRGPQRRRSRAASAPCSRRKRHERRSVRSRGARRLRALRGDRAMLLERWHEELVDAYRGKARHPVGVALGDAVHRFHLPEDCFLDLLAGIEIDLRGAEIETFAELEHYCYCVASTIGLLVCGVRGLRGASVRDYAVNLGIAVQLTNVLRDV